MKVVKTCTLQLSLSRGPKGIIIKKIPQIQILISGLPLLSRALESECRILILVFAWPSGTLSKVTCRAGRDVQDPFGLWSTFDFGRAHRMIPMWNPISTPNRA